MDFKLAPRFSMHNRPRLEKVSECACYYCLKVFSPKEIKEWVDKNDTAICPYCSVDTVIPIYEEGEKDMGFLKKINEYWF